MTPAGTLPFEVHLLLSHLLPKDWRDLAVADVSGGELGAGLSRTRGGLKRLDVYLAVDEIAGPRGKRSPMQFVDAADLPQEYDVILGVLDDDPGPALRHAAFAGRPSGLVLFVLPISSLSTAAFGRATRLWAPRIVLSLSPRIRGLGDRVVCVWAVADAGLGLRSMSRFMVAEWMQAGAPIRYIIDHVQPVLSAGSSPPAAPTPGSEPPEAG